MRYKLPQTPWESFKWCWRECPLLLTLAFFLNWPGPWVYSVIYKYHPHRDLRVGGAWFVIIATGAGFIGCLIANYVRLRRLREEEAEQERERKELGIPERREDLLDVTSLIAEMPPPTIRLGTRKQNGGNK